MTIPWTVRYALAAHDAGKPLPAHLLMSVQMLRNGGGCASCYAAHPRIQTLEEAKQGMGK